MAHFASVPRDAIYGNGHWQAKPESTTKESAGGKADTLTWQQKNNFGNLNSRKRPGRKSQKWLPLDLDAQAKPTTPNPTASEGAWGDPFASASFGAFGIALSPAAAPSKPDNSKPSEPASPQPASNTKKQQQDSNCPKRKSRRQKPNKRQNMATPHDPGFIPPHLRKRTGAEPRAIAQGTSRLSNPTGNDGSPTTPKPTRNPKDPRPKSPPSPPVSSPALPLGEFSAAVLEQWEDPKPETPAASKQKNSRWARNIPRNKWPKASEMRPRPDDQESDGGVSFKSNSNGDPDYDVKKLMAWNGDWLPPPEEWSARKSFADRHFGASIEKWINGHRQEPTAIDTSASDFIGRPVLGELVITHGGESWGQKVINCDIAPRCWIPIQIEGQAPQQFWSSFATRAPQALSDIDLDDREAWWESYPASGHALAPVTVPDAAIDEDDPENNVPSIGLTSEQGLRKFLMRREEGERRKRERQNRPTPAYSPPSDYQAPPDRRLQPSVNIYLRPVIARDATDIAVIYNHYVRETIFANEFTDRSPIDMLNRINDVKSAGLPFIVAVDRGNPYKCKSKGNSERVVGYCSLDDYCDAGSMYRFTFELDLYVHPDFLRKSVAKCLIDKVLEMSNTGYNARGGYSWINNSDYLKHGPTRRIKCINANVAHKHKADMDWMTKFMDEYQFKRSGHLKRMGYKKGDVVDLTVYQHFTLEDINPDHRPTVPL
ncbi:hypothetical protein BS50DRAFT_627562 [Corynespora cassiicola Philippines]|uniref:N-acetyltransferase domain-containing protein n=1 Tax=Corynespora cassiicola Philippines TaxID=1448308 RepID=A0A2T2P998_CORCC|nr:hypothetical protein BS50DRAFT_627562 [Corynespora cassiicola Philippines]